MPLSPSPTLFPPARLTYLAISAICRRQLFSHSTSSSSSSGNYSHFANQPYTGYYEPGGPTQGPLRDASSTLRITPKTLKDHLDAFVVGQDRAKRVLSTAVYNHYRRIQELQRRDEEAEEAWAQEERRRMSRLNRHPVEGMERDLRDEIYVPALTRERGEDEFPGQAATVGVWGEAMDGAAAKSERGGMDGEQAQHSQPKPQSQQTQSGPAPLHDATPLTIEKSNILLLGPSGVGKTLMAKTLARVLEVPFSMSDCTPFTQAGYIGEDAEVCVQRLLSAANYDVERAERGIICLDELDKIATAKVSHGKDVSGEGVQQSLLKIIEGTTVQVQAKSERSSSSSPGSSSRGTAHGFPTNSPLSGGNNPTQNMSGGTSSTAPPQKGETYNVRTDNILFICAGAFNGLPKIILDRLSKGSIGFNAPVRASVSSASSLSSSSHNPHSEHETFVPLPSSSSSATQKRTQTLSHLLPTDLHTYGLIPELTGRLPLAVPLHPLTLPQLTRVLTEPRNALLRQYEQLFALSNLELRLTRFALKEVAERARGMGTGARGLRGVMEAVLQESMFECPGSAVRSVFVGKGAVEGSSGGAAAEVNPGVRWFARTERKEFLAALAEEEEAFEREEAEKERLKAGKKEHSAGTGGLRPDGGPVRTFEEYRSTASAGGG